jgi:hypothetical protein
MNNYLSLITHVVHYPPTDDNNPAFEEKNKYLKP